MLCKHWVIEGLRKLDKNLFAIRIQQLFKMTKPLWKMWKSFFFVENIWMV